MPPQCEHLRPVMQETPVDELEVLCGLVWRRERCDVMVEALHMVPSLAEHCMKDRQSHNSVIQVRREECSIQRSWQNTNSGLKAPYLTPHLDSLVPVHKEKAHHNPDTAFVCVTATLPVSQQSTHGL